ncbi:MAG: hypothetical protein ACI9G1_004254 [Pirellulaceae bacterium]|jgi:hypothetical protein
MRTHQIFAVGSMSLVMFLGTLQADELSKDEKDAGFISMFNGKDFDGWRFTGGAVPETVTNWKVENGVIHLTGGGRPNLGTEKAYRDFEMRFQWRALRENYNSGFYIRSGKDVSKNQINLAKGSEGKFLGRLPGSSAVPDLQMATEEWNDWQVQVVGDKVIFHCNGKLAWEATGLTPAAGHIGFQAEGAPLEFRNLRIREITQSEKP